ncbi:phosphatase PAP2 family protein [Eisenibacter elegans]|jgi:undecaprenyl-diphosphatase|uniref:phosphatase PAP2 family protein n=1 Tax=Eisenibacter elegans TaxID=997 RepID=UPI0003F6AEBD|nr:phosphatase PAP2 family protein [Eisenibacter elegans]
MLLDTAGVLPLLSNWDTDLFLWLNQRHLPILDSLMFNLSKTTVWIPFYLGLLVMAYYSLAKNLRQTLLLVIFIALTVVAADRFTSGVMKPYFERLRPSHEPSLQGQVHLVNDYRGGKYGFASSHAANTFALATFFGVALYDRWPLWARLGLFGWAVLVSYTRIYLGVHYPADILAGALVGGLFALGGAWAWQRLSSS